MSAGNATGTWFPVALGRDIGNGTAAPVRLQGREIALWRSEGGTLHAWEDRCPHRGMRLSFGFVRGEQLACLYHGWHYGAEGGCEQIPAHPDLVPPKTICATVFPCREVDGLVWVSPERASVPREEPPSLYEGTFPVRSLTVDAAAETVVEHLIETAKATFRSGLASLVLADDVAAGTCVLAIQPVDPGRTSLHILAGGERSPSRLAKIAHWSESLRRRLEAPTIVADVA